MIGAEKIRVCVEALNGDMPHKHFIDVYNMNATFIDWLSPYSFRVPSSVTRPLSMHLLNINVDVLHFSSLHCLFLRQT